MDGLTKKTNSLSTGVKIAATVGFASIGAAFWQWEGLSLATSVAGMLFWNEESGQHAANNETIKPTTAQTSLDVVPYVFGTDLSPGMLTRLDSLGYTTYIISGEYGQAMSVENMEVYFHDHHYNYYDDTYGGGGYINNIWFDKYHIWDVLHPWDFFRQLEGYPDSASDLINFDILGPEYSYGETYIRYSGMFGEPGNHTSIINWTRFPNIKAEITGPNISVSDNWAYRQHLAPFVDNNTANASSYPHSFRDSNDEYFYGIIRSTSPPTTGEYCCIRKWSIYDRRYKNYYDFELDKYVNPDDLIDPEVAYNTITRGSNDSMEFSRQDGDRLYFFIGRHWYHAGKWHKHHALYSIIYDIFYIDRTDHTVHSVVYNKTFNVGGRDGISGSNPTPALFFKSMEIVGDEILLFGYEYQSEVIRYDYFEINIQEDSSQSKVYLEYLSLYPEGYWNDCWAYVTADGRDYRKILIQTNEYIIVQGGFVYDIVEGLNVCITRRRENQADYSIIGEGSTRNIIYCTIPNTEDVGFVGSEYYDQVYLKDHDWPYHKMINWTLTDKNFPVVYLTGDLYRDPIPGEKLFFTFSGDVAKDYDQTTPEDTIFYPNYLPLICEGKWKNAYYCGLWDGYIPTRFINVNWDGFTHSVMVKIDKTTGVFKGYGWEDNARAYKWYQSWSWVIGTTNLSTVKTDAGIMCTYTTIEPGSAVIHHSIIFSTSSGYPIIQEIFPLDDGYYVECKGAIQVKLYNSTTGVYENHWIALIFNKFPISSTNSSNQGTYLLDLGTSGAFPMWPLLGNGIKFRSNFGGGWIEITSSGTRIESPGLRKYDYDQKVFFTLSHGYTNNETWCWKPPSQYNSKGYSWLLNCSNESWFNLSGSYGSYLRSNKYALGIGDQVVSNYCDTNPIGVVYRLSLDDSRNPHYYTSDYASLNYCYELIDDIVYFNDDEIPIKEPRFLFSKSINRKYNRLDLIKEVLATCQGIIVPAFDAFAYFNSAYTKFKVHIPNPNEEPVFYFGYDFNNFTVTEVSDDFEKVYGDFSAYPDNYWFGDMFVLSYEGNDYYIEIVEQTSTYIMLGSGIAIREGYSVDPVYPIVDTSFTLKKDNIKEGSFTFWQKSYRQKANVIRIDYKNRLLGYITDTVEYEDLYRTEIVDHERRIQHIKMDGIKRATQAGRMVMKLMDYENYVNWMCSFSTDIAGYLLEKADIICVSHVITGWDKKMFRIMSIDYEPDYEIRLELEEYIPDVYHDHGIPVYQSSAANNTNSINYSDMVVSIGRFFAFEDSDKGKLYIAVSPAVEDKFWTGAIIYTRIKGESDWVVNSKIVNICSSCISTDEIITIEQTEIPYVEDSVSGTFPSDGYLWLGRELIKYSNIDTVNNKFLGCVRNVKYFEQTYFNDTLEINEYSPSQLIVLADYDNIFNISIDPDWEGETIEMKAISFNIFNMHSPDSLAPIIEIDIKGYSERPHPIDLPRKI